MKNTFLTIITIVPTIIMSAASSSSSDSHSAAPGMHTVVTFNKSENHINEARRLVLSVARDSRVDKKTKKVLETCGNFLLWFADQNEATIIKNKTIAIVPNALKTYNTCLKTLQHAWCGYRQAQAARTDIGLPESEAYLTLIHNFDITVKAAFVVCAGRTPDFEKPAVKTALASMQAHAAVRILVKRKARIESPTKRERATTQPITRFFAPMTPLALIDPIESTDSDDSDESTDDTAAHKKQRTLRFE